MGQFKGMREAAVYEKGEFLGPGIYELEIEKCLIKKSRKSGDLFICEMRVFETSDEKSHPVGSKRTWIQKMQDTNVAFGSLKLFTYAVLGKDPTLDKAEIEKDVDPAIEELLESAVDATQNEFGGSKVRCEVVMKLTQANKNFSQHIFSPSKAA